MNNKPISIPKANGVDKVLEIFALSMILAMIIVPLILYSRLPERIPSHYNVSGEIDSYSNKISVFILPIICLLVVYLPITILQRFPHTFNFPVKVTERNADSLYVIGIRIIRYIKLLVIVIFVLLLTETLLCAFNIQHGRFVFYILYGIDIVFFPLIIIVGIKKMRHIG